MAEAQTAEMISSSDACGERQGRVVPGCTNCFAPFWLASHTWTSVAQGLAWARS
jgi:hypothetical protein